MQLTVYDNALAETVNGVFKAELIRRLLSWRSLEHVELATPPSGSTGEITPVSTAPSATFHRLSSKQTTISTGNPTMPSEPMTAAATGGSSPIGTSIDTTHVVGKMTRVILGPAPRALLLRERLLIQALENAIVLVGRQQVQQAI